MDDREIGESLLGKMQKALRHVGALMDEMEREAGDAGGVIILFVDSQKTDKGYDVALHARIDPHPGGGEIGPSFKAGNGNR